MKSEYCKYPPRLAADVASSEQRDGDRTAVVTGSVSAGRFLLLGASERKVLELLDGLRTPGELCDAFKHKYGGTLTRPTLNKFLTRLDEVGILAGDRKHKPGPADLQMSFQFYSRFKLFNPDRLFTWMTARLRFVWTPGFVVFSLALTFLALFLSLLNAAEIADYTTHTIQEHYVAILIAGAVVGLSHEFAHGLTCKAFGGRVPEVGLLLIYYLMPALYCNVSSIALIPQRSRRLWVIAAGVYWQLIVGTAALLAWFALAPYSIAADLAFIFFAGSVFDLVFNANPLIKLDGYYFLSQWLRLPNLMDRSRAYWRGRLGSLITIKRREDLPRWSKRERKIYAAYGLFSFSYAVVLRLLILWYVGGFLAGRFHTIGVVFTAGLAVMYSRRAIKALVSAAFRPAVRMWRRIVRKQSEAIMNNDVQADTNGQLSNRQPDGESKQPRAWRRRVALAATAASLAGVLLLPWDASVGSYGVLSPIPDHEAIIRAPEDGTLIELSVYPGQTVAPGSVVGRLGSLQLEEQLVQVESELARANGEHERLLGELRTRDESGDRAEVQLSQREREYEAIDDDQRKIDQRRRVEVSRERLTSASYGETPQVIPAAYRPAGGTALGYPPAIAALQSDVDLRRAKSDEARIQLERLRRLFNQGVVARGELDSAETRAATLETEMAGAAERLEAAVVEHRRRHTSTASEMRVARSDLDVQRLEVERVRGELRAMSDFVVTLEARRDLLRRKQGQFELRTRRGGTVFGEELPRMTGQYFQKGAEICRVADTDQLLVRIDVPERQFGDVRIGHPVRLKARAFPDRTFYGVVSKTGAESEPDRQGEAAYRVELTIDNADGLLRPGMTAFARIDFGRQMIGRILLHKIKQALRPELWMF
jgi:putative peptide zinc metalloprotease protein